MELVRQWLLSVTCAALITALADGLMPKGAVKQVGKLVCALVLLCAVLRPVLSVQLPDTGQLLCGLQGEVERSKAELQQDSEQMLKTLIEQECGAYIVDKAAQLGAVCRAQVECQADEAGIWMPRRASVCGQLNDAQRKELTAQVRSALGIDPERIVYAGGELVGM